MPVDAFIHLDRLRCLAEQDASGHSEPYAWTVLLWVDDTTIGSGQFVGSSAPGNASARLVIKGGMREGDQATMPSRQRTFARRFEDGLAVRNIGIVVALFEEDETPPDAVRAGYDAFVRELPRALAQFVRENLRGPETDAEREEIADAVRPKVREAVEDELSAFEKVQVFLGSLDLDDELGFDAALTAIDESEGDPRPFTLTFEKSATILGVQIRNHYELDGRFELREPPRPDPCQAEIDRVTRAQGQVDGIEAQIRSSQDELRDAPPQEKAALIAEIRRLRLEELPPAVAALEAARRALARCRTLQPADFGDLVVVGEAAGGIAL
jgi:hypothetical protein